jgi:hypothetical protein
MGLGAIMRDTQANVPLAKWLQTQLTFKDLMIHEILPFAPSIAFRYILHRCESRDSRCRESLWFYTRVTFDTHNVFEETGGIISFMFLGADRAEVRCSARRHKCLPTI